MNFVLRGGLWYSIDVQVGEICNLRCFQGCFIAQEIDSVTSAEGSANRGSSTFRIFSVLLLRLTSSLRILCHLCTGKTPQTWIDPRGVMDLTCCDLIEKCFW